MTEARFEEGLRSVLDGETDLIDTFGPEGIRRVETFKDAGVLTMNAGLVITLRDGTEIQLTIVCSRRGRDDRDDE